MAYTREQHCTHLNQDWCDCDWCRYLRTVNRNRNARFWEWVNDGRVRITLKPGQRLEWYTRSRHDEGWSSEYMAWKWDGNMLTRESETDGRDCDGRFSTQQTVISRDLNGRTVEIDGDTWTAPEWERVDASQRDYSAEAANY